MAVSIKNLFNKIKDYRLKKQIKQYKPENNKVESTQENNLKDKSQKINQKGQNLTIKNKVKGNASININIVNYPGLPVEKTESKSCNIAEHEIDQLLED